MPCFAVSRFAYFIYNVFVPGLHGFYTDEAIGFYNMGIIFFRDLSIFISTSSAIISSHPSGVFGMP